jgi:prophage maintenance system killer protein/prophage antirepressor-like protein
MESRGEIVIYKAKDGKGQVEVRLDRDTLWLSLQQVADLFGRDKSVVSRHFSNIFRTNELNRASAVAKNATTAADGKTYQVEYFNLDAILSVGYRVNSKRGTQFRIWATQVLKDHLLRGYTVNEKRLLEQNTRLKELQKTVELMGRLIDGRDLQQDQATGLLKVITDYAHALTLLDQYDHQRLTLSGTTAAPAFTITYEMAKDGIARLGAQDGAGGGLFGREKDDSFRSSIATIYQTFGGRDVYPSLEEKAAHLLYFVIKNHSFVDGNKRIGAFLFLWFMEANGILYGAEGRKRLGDNALVALTLMIAESRASDKDTIVKVIVNLINKDNP